MSDSSRDHGGAGYVGPVRVEVVERGVLALAVLVFLVLWFLRIGPAPLLIAPWVVIALVASRMVVRSGALDDV